MMHRQLGWFVLLAICVVGFTFARDDSPSAIWTFAGTGKAGLAGDGGPAISALLNQPFHCEDDGSGGLLVAEAFNHCIRRIDFNSGRISTVAGSGKKGYAGDGGPAAKALLNEPYAVVSDKSGDLYIVDRLNARIRKVDRKSGIITTVAGNGEKGNGGDGGPAIQAQLREPNDCCLDGTGGLLIADVADWRVRRVDLKSGLISTFAGIGKERIVSRTKIGDDGPADMALIVGARAVCVDGKGHTFICEREGNAIRIVDATGIIKTFAGTGAKGYAGDGGPASKATFNGPKAIRCDRAGNLLIVDTENHAIRRIEMKSGVITTVAGGRKGSRGDEGPAEAAGLDRPHGCCVDAKGSLYIADSNNQRVRVVR